MISSLGRKVEGRGGRFGDYCLWSRVQTTDEWCKDVRCSWPSQATQGLRVTGSCRLQPVVRTPLCSLCVGAWLQRTSYSVDWRHDQIIASVLPPHHDHQPRPPPGAGPLHHGPGRGHQQAVHHLQREDPGCVLLSSGEAQCSPSLSSSRIFLYRRSRSLLTECWSSLSR